MKIQKHKFKFLRQSMVILKGKTTVIDVYECIYCKKLQIIDNEACKIISLNGQMGEEVEI